MALPSIKDGAEGEKEKVNYHDCVEIHSSMYTHIFTFFFDVNTIELGKVVYLANQMKPKKEELIYLL